MNNKITIKTALLIFGAIAGYMFLTFCLHFFIEKLMDVSYLQSCLIVACITGPMVPAVWDKISATNNTNT